MMLFESDLLVLTKLSQVSIPYTTITAPASVASAVQAATAAGKPTQTIGVSISLGGQLSVNVPVVMAQLSLDPAVVFSLLKALPLPTLLPLPQDVVKSLIEHLPHPHLLHKPTAAVRLPREACAKFVASATEESEDLFVTAW